MARAGAPGWTGTGTARSVSADGIGDNSADRLVSLWSELSFGHPPRDDHNHNRDDDDDTSAPPHLVYRSPTTRIYRCHQRDEGIKVSSRACIEHERRIAFRLPVSCPRRHVFNVARWSDDDDDGDDTSFSYRFDWVNGITLDEWIVHRERRKPTKEADLRARLEVATALAKALGECHAGGVAHHKLEPANIIVEAPAGGHCAVNLIDLSRAVPLTGGQDDDGDGASRRTDLEQLGRVFQRLFGGEDAAAVPPPCEPPREPPREETRTVAHESDEESDCGDAGRGKRGKSSRAVEGVPLYLTAVIDALLQNNGSRGGNNDRETYENIPPVLADLKTASRKFDTYLCRGFDQKEASLLNRLPIPRMAFYGRQSELGILKTSLHSVCAVGKPAMTVVSGHAGIGKTALVDQIKIMIKEKEGYLIRGKFNMSCSRSDTVLYEALNSFFGTFVENKFEDAMAKAKMRRRVARAFECGTEATAMDLSSPMEAVAPSPPNTPCVRDLMQSIPNLGRFLGNCFQQCGHASTPISQGRLLKRSKFLLCKLIGAIADEESPVVLMFDDLQWCDETTLSVIETIVSDPDVRYCLYVGCYRNESETPSIEKMISAVQSQGVGVFIINLAPLDKESVNMLISESMCLPPSLSQPLSTILHGKCAGSPLFLRSFLSDGMIRFNLTTRRWDYDIQQIVMKEIPGELVQYMASRMSQLPLSFRLVLKLASCLGHSFDAVTFMKANVKSDYDLARVLPSVCQIGFIHEVSRGKFMWAHDEVRASAHALIPKNMRESFHLLIGTRMLMNTPESELETTIFYILGHMNKGIRLIQPPEQKYEIADLNLRAGKLSILTSSFHSAAEYFMNGIALLPDECFEHQYNLSVELHNAAQGALFATGDFAMMNSLSSKVLTNACCFDDKIFSYNNLVGYLISTNQLEDAINLCSKVLDELGESMEAPIMDITIPMCIKEFIKVKFMIGLKTEKNILDLPRMVDKRKLVLMDFLQRALSATPNISNPNAGGIVTFRMVKLSLKHGLCDASTVAFASMGICLIHLPHEDFQNAFFYASLALKALNYAPGTNRFKARVFTMIYGFITIWRDPLQANLEKLLEGYNAGCCIGDQEFAYWALLSYAGLALHGGKHLATVGQTLTTFVRRGIQCQQMAAAFSIAPTLAAAVELAGDANKQDIYSLFSTTEDMILSKQNDRRCCMLIWNKRKFTCIYKGDMDGAVQMYKLSLIHPFGALARPLKTMPHIMNVFTDGLIGYFEARKHQEDEQQWSTLGKDALKHFKKWVGLSKWNFSNKLYLLEAEDYFLKGKTIALEKYEASIVAARNHRFPHEEGLAYTKLAYYHVAQGRGIDAKQCFKQAGACYKRWGAHVLVKKIEINII